MRIASGSVDINENAKKLRNEVKGSFDNHDQKWTDIMKNRDLQYENLMNGKITQSTKDPWSAGDNNNHNKGDLWVQADNSGASKMWVYGDNGWEQQKWDKESMAIKNLSSLSADVGELKAGTINGVKINATEMAIDMNNGYGAAGDKGHNPLYWDAPTYSADGGDNRDYTGFHFKNGLMSFKGRRLNPNTLTYNYDGYDSTYIAPNDIKLRNTYDAEASNLTNRVDIRSNYIVVGSSWDDTDCARIFPTNHGEMYAGTGGFNNLIAYSELRSGGGWLEVGSTLHSKYDLRADNSIVSNGEGNFGSASVGKGGLSNNGNTNFYGNLYVSGYPTFGNWLNGNAATFSWNVHAHDFVHESAASVKTDIEKYNDKEALMNILGTDLYSYKYKDDNTRSFVSPVIDDISKENEYQYKTSNNLIRKDEGHKHSISIPYTVSMLIGSIHELQKQNENMLFRISKLEGEK